LIIGTQGLLQRPTWCEHHKEGRLNIKWGGTGNAPVTRSRPDDSCFRNTARLPRKWPERRITTVPGVMDDRSLQGCDRGGACSERRVRAQEQT